MTWHSGSDVPTGWSPDAKYLLFAGKRDTANYSLFALDVKTGATRRLTEDYATINSANYSPDAKTVVYGRYGFYDSFNPSFDHADVVLDFGRHVSGQGWFASDYIAVDQGPILLMLENYRTGAVWAKLRSSAWQKRGLQTAGFRGGWIEE